MKVPRITVSTLILQLSLSVLYIIAGKIGLLLAQIHPSASSVWPPTGFAIGVGIVLGFRVWPAIFLGAFVVNATTAGTFWTSFAIASGNTFEALLAIYLVNKFASGPACFERSIDVFRFTILAAIFSTLFSPTIGVTSLCYIQLAHWEDYGRIWLTWWLGDFSGALIAAPPIILFYRNWRGKLRLRDRDKAILTACAILFVSCATFTNAVFNLTGQRIFGLLLVPLILFSAFRFGNLGASLATLAISTVAIIGTFFLQGPFSIASPSDALLILQAYVSVINLIGLFVAAAVKERSQAEMARLTTQTQLGFIADAIPSLISYVDSEQRFLFSNRAYNEGCGIGAHLILGRRLDEVLSDQEYNDIKAHVAAALSGKKVDFETNVGFGRKIRYFKNSFVPLISQDTAVLGFCSFAQEITQQKLAEQRLDMQYFLIKELSLSSGLNQVSSKILRAIGEAYCWDAGGLWIMDEHSNPPQIRCLEFWSAPDMDADIFKKESQRRHFGVGEDLPGRVFNSARPDWVTNLELDSILPRSWAANVVGFRSAFAFPITSNDSKVLAVIELYACEVRPSEDDTIKMLTALGSQISQLFRPQNHQPALQFA